MKEYYQRCGRCRTPPVILTRRPLPIHATDKLKNYYITTVWFIRWKQIPNMTVSNLAFANTAKFLVSHTAKIGKSEKTTSSRADYKQMKSMVSDHHTASWLATSAHRFFSFS